MENIINQNSNTKSTGNSLNFILLISGQLVSTLGTSIFSFALSLYVLDLIGSAIAFSTVLVLGLIPKIFVNMFAGVFIDRYSRKVIIVTADILSGITVLVFMVLISRYSGSLLLIISATVILALFNSFFQLALTASIPNIVEENRVLKSNSIMQAILASTNILGPVLGALSYNLFGIWFVFLINGISFIVSGLSEIFLRFKTNTEFTVKSNNYFEEIKEGFIYINEQKIIKFLLKFVFIIQIIGVPLIVLIVPYITYRILKVSSFQLSVIEASWAVGMIIGSVLVGVQKSPNKLLKNFFVLLEFQALIIMLCFFPIIPFFAKSTWIITIVFSILIVIVIILNVMQSAPLLSYFQMNTPENIRARLFGVFNTVMMVAPPLGMWIYGIIMHRVVWPAIPVVSGLIMLLFSLYASRNKHFKSFIASLEKK
ncbi:MAG: MFS transporter [Clostridia bacterium]|nr:MFS transporter [Clostridia bacterium]